MSSKSTKAVDYKALLKRISSVNILCVGDLILDAFIHGDVQRLSREAPIPILLKSDSHYNLGGVGNVATNIMALGGKCHLIAPVGFDSAADEIEAILESKRAIIPSMVFCDERVTTEKQRYVAGHQQILRVDSENSSPISNADGMRILEAAKLAIKECDAMILSDYRQGALPAELLQSLIQLAKKHKIPTFVDPRSDDFSIYKGADYATPNRAEIIDATGMAVETDAQVEKTARHVIKQCGIKNMLVTRSEEGMSLVSKTSAHHIPTEAIDVFDVAGAGDTVLAAFALAFAAGATSLQAAEFANIAAGVVVEKNEVATVSPQEILDRLSEQDFRSQRLQRRAQTKIVGSKRADEKQALAQVKKWRKQGAEIGFTNGCFDIVHAGHLSLLQQAAEQADKLIVAVNSDASVRRLKGKGRPMQTEDRRLELLAHLDMVDLVIIFDEDTPERLIELFIPDVLIKGKDYEGQNVPGGDFVESHGGRVFLGEFKEGLSSSSIIQKIHES